MTGQIYMANDRARTEDGEPSPMDIHVGMRLRLRRTLHGLTQQQLAARAGLTFQQVQKYESGANRISASRLYEFGQVLRVPIAYFFQETNDRVLDVQDRMPVNPETRGETLELVPYYSRILSNATLQRLLELAQAIASGSPMSSDYE